MNSIDQLIAEIEKEDEAQKQNYEKSFKARKEKYEKLSAEILKHQAEAKSCRENVVKNCVHLIANKHSIKQVLEQTEEIDGLPVSSNCHENTIEFFTQSVKFINNFESFNNQDSWSPDELQQKIVSLSQSLADHLKDLNNDKLSAQSLYQNTRRLKLAHGNIADESDTFNPGEV